MTLKNPDRVIVDIQGAWLSAKVKREIAVSSRFVNDIRIGQFNKNTVRLVVENKVGSSNYKIFPLTGGTDERLIRVVFNGAAATGSPLIARMAVERGIEANIVYASTKSIGGKVYGSMLLGIPNEESQVQTATEYLTGVPNVAVQVVTTNVS